MKVCYFGNYEQTYTRNRIIIKGLKKNGVDVVECNDRSQIFFRYLKLIKKHLSIADYDVMIVGESGQPIMPLGKILSKMRKKHLIFDPFISLYDTSVFDKKSVKEGSIKASILYYLDRYSCYLADIVLTDTDQHAKYFNEEFGVPITKMRTVYIGADSDIFYPRDSEKEDDTFKVVFHGSFLPLHGISYIIKAAKLLENEHSIQFEIIGKGQTYDVDLALSKKLDVKNIIFKNWMPFKVLPKHIAKADVYLGIFGDTNKAKRVIPNKAYEVIAMKKPLITGDSPAIREAFTNRENVLLCEMANPESLANAILELKDNEKLRENIAKNGYKLYKERFSPEKIGKEMIKIIEYVIC
ncbi:MAG: group 1 glycosyl transferase [Candidatus Syntrophoarchaeum caldarius]|uniref:Group 1 glycosyl transferase n=1 Tax=Candidatus Syntropharchaeum caldarium TaxID=1838285 RepID=A0A1F2P8J5_9EURY|nr:MAG: group 1 glycosyl transferase [Candidatus Syntrophoarchaeum caldarius]